jgi:hypothetical protein
MISAKILLIIFVIATAIGVGTISNYSELSNSLHLENFQMNGKTIKVELSDGITGSFGNG